VIELTGQPDYAGELRKLTGARGALFPSMGEMIAPVVDVGPALFHAFALPRITASARDLFASGSRTFAVQNQYVDRILVLRYGEYTWAPGTSTPFTVVQRFGAANPTPVVSPSAITITQNDPRGTQAALRQVNGATASTLLYELGYSRDLQRTFHGDAQDVLFPGQALVITFEHADAGTRLFGFRMSFNQFVLPSQ
jgi:hypothetical protein